MCTTCFRVVSTKNDILATKALQTRDLTGPAVTGPLTVVRSYVTQKLPCPNIRRGRRTLPGILHWEERREKKNFQEWSTATTLSARMIIAHNVYKRLLLVSYIQVNGRYCYCFIDISDHLVHWMVKLYKLIDNYHRQIHQLYVKSLVLWGFFSTLYVCFLNMW